MRTIRVRNGEHTFAYRYQPGQEDKILRAIALHLRQGKITRAGAAKLRNLVRPRVHHPATRRGGRRLPWGSWGPGTLLSGGEHPRLTEATKRQIGPWVSRTEGRREPDRRKRPLLSYRVVQSDVTHIPATSGR